MIQVKAALLSCLLVCAFSLKAASDTLPESVLRIGILEKVPLFNLSSETAYTLVELNTGHKKDYKPDSICLVEAKSERICVNDDSYQAPVRVTPKGDKGFLRVNGKRYRDSLLIRKDAQGRLTVINELGLDGYLYGILPQEVSPDWPLECLKAQAVASRTFALKNLRRHESDGYHLCARVHCQDYGGLAGGKE